MTADETPIDGVRRYYSEKIAEHGATPQGVDWRDEGSQNIRFAQLALLLENDQDASLADIGCGYGALAPFLRARGWRGHYEGVDVSEAMIGVAREQLQVDPNFRLTVGQAPAQSADYVIASGIFNVKGATPADVWKSYVLRTVDEIVAFSRKGAAFNFLTSWSDAPFMRDDLFYAAPEDILKYCARHHSRWLEVSQDYGLFEFTVRLRLDRPAARLRIEK